MKNRKLILAFLAFLAVVAVAVGVLAATQQLGGGDDDGTTNPAVKRITVTVVHSDGTKKEFAYETTKNFLGSVLYGAGLISESASAGMFDTVDGEKADWNVDQSYWALYLGENYATKGVDETPVYDGDCFRLVYTRG